MRVYYFLGSLLRPFATIGFFIYGHILHTPRVRVIVRNEKNELLLLQNWLGGNEWSLPGGGVDRGEEMLDAAQRELREETGIIEESENFIHQLTLRSFGHDEVIYEITVSSDKVVHNIPNKFEIQKIAWFPGSNLPELGPLANQVLTKMDLKR